jgi:spermidine/putrescine transport system substrate-binding protein
MRRKDMLEKLDKTQIPNWRHLNPSFLSPTYDPHADYSVPFIWGITGVFYNKHYYNNQPMHKWSDLWQSRFNNELLLLDDMREVFSIALLTLGYSINDTNPQHIKQAFTKLKSLMANVKLFASDTVVSTIIDEDATIGMVWNGDAYKAHQENNAIQFVFPDEGFAIWVDNFVMLKNAAHKSTAYLFINYILRPDVAKRIALATGYPTTNLTGQQLLPKEIRTNTTMYPPANILRRGEFQTDVGEEVSALYEKYWEELKMMG